MIIFEHSLTGCEERNHH